MIPIDFFAFMIQSRDSLLTAIRLFSLNSRKLAITHLFLDILTCKNYRNFFKYMSFECQNICQQLNKPVFKRKFVKKAFFWPLSVYTPLNFFVALTASICIGY